MKSERFLAALGEIDEKYIEEARCCSHKKKFDFKPIAAIAASVVFMIASIFAVNNLAKIPPVQQSSEKIGASGEFDVYEGDIGMGSAGAGRLNVEHEREFFLNTAGTDFIDKSKVNTSKEIQICGKKLVGTYKNSTDSDYYRDGRDNYEAAENGRKISISLSRETGKCTLFFLHKSDEEMIENIYTRDECYEIAKDHLSSYIDDIEDYELKYEYKRMGGFGYFFMLYRTVGGIMTSDRITVGVRENGEVYAHTLHSIDTMKNADISALDMGKAEAALDAKVREVYRNTFDVSYRTESVVLSRLKDGSYILDYFLTVEASNEKGGAGITEECQFIVAVK